MAHRLSRFYGKDRRCVWFTAASVWTMVALYTFPISAADVDIPGIQDPTRPVHFVAPQAEQAQERRLQLQAIYIGSDRAEAVINGRRLVRGNTINGALILAVAPDRVFYERDGERAELLLRPRIIKPSVAEE